MIAEGYTGWRPGGLIAYLFGPGRHEEHIDPRIVAGTYVLPPARRTDTGSGPGGAVVSGEHDLGPLIDYLSHPARLAGLPAGRPAGAGPPRRGYVWHVAIRLHPDDPVLSDAAWQVVAERVAARTGIAAAGCPWVAVRHGDDHVHLAATLVCQRHTGEWVRFHPRWWKARLRAVCRELEDEHGWRATAGWDGTASAAPGLAESKKAARTGLEPARVTLRRAVGRAAATSGGPDEFAAGLAEAGVALRYNHDAGGMVRGYAVALPTDRDGAGGPIYYSGSRLAAALSWPTLAATWSQTRPGDTSGADAAGAETARPGSVTDPAAVAAVYEQAGRAAGQARTAVRAGGLAAEEVAPAVAGLLAGLPSRRTAEWVRRRPQEWERAGPVFAPAGRAPRGFGAVPAGELSSQLRHAGRMLARLNAYTPLHARPARAQFVLALAALLAEIAAWHQQHGRRAQAQAAAATAELVRPATRATTSGPPRAARTQNQVAAPPRVPGERPPWHRRGVAGAPRPGPPRSPGPARPR